jgi:hypothetical protein
MAKGGKERTGPKARPWRTAKEAFSLSRTRSATGQLRLYAGLRKWSDGSAPGAFFERAA